MQYWITLAQDSTSSVEVESVWAFIVKGGPMMIPIGLCSFVALTVFIERLVSLRRRRVVPAGILETLKGILSGTRASHEKAIKACQADGSPMANVLAAGVRKLDRSQDAMEKAIVEAGEREAIKLGKYLRVLTVIAAVSPLLGLLGTIFGMIEAFQTVAASPDAMGKTEKLAGGIYEAMITTAAGLMVAIPVLIMYHFVSAKVDRRVMEIDALTVEFLDHPSVAGRPALPLDAAAAATRPAPADVNGESTAADSERKASIARSGS